jgi:hypothetical protein
MKKAKQIPLHILYYIVIITLLVQFQLFSQTTKGTDKSAAQIEREIKVKYGFYGGVNIPLAPDEMTRVPKIYDKASESLMNGLDGLGFKSSYIIGIQSKFNLSYGFWLGSSFSYSSWLSNNSCKNGPIPKVNSENFLSLFTFSIIPNYYLTDFLYLGAGADVNLFSVDVKEIGSQRGDFEFQQKYSRLGLCLEAGTDFQLFKDMSLDISVKAQLVNFIGRHDDNPATIQSEALISPQGSTLESHILLLQINLGIMFSSY